MRIRPLGFRNMKITSLSMAIGLTNPMWKSQLTLKIMKSRYTTALKGHVVLAITCYSGR